MLGIDDPYLPKPESWRDYYCANPGDKQMAALVELGAVELYSTRDRYEWFRTTAAGRAAAFASFKTIRKSKSARVYAKFLNICDCYPDLTFKKFITDQQFAEYRRSA